MLRFFEQGMAAADPAFVPPADGDYRRMASAYLRLVVMGVFDN